MSCSKIGANKKQDRVRVTDCRSNLTKRDGI